MYLNRYIIIAAMWLPFTAMSENFGLGDIATIIDRGDGLFDVVCKNGDTEEGVSIQKLVSGDVCEKGKLISMVRFDNLEFHGICSMRSIRQTDRLAGSYITFSSFDISPKKPIDGCFPFLRYRVPKGYRVGFKTIDATLLIGKEYNQAVSLLLSGNVADGQPSLTKKATGPGKKTVTFDFPEPIFSGCEEGTNLSEIQFSLILSMAELDNSSSMKGSKARLVSLKFKDSFIEKCSK